MGHTCLSGAKSKGGKMRDLKEEAGEMGDGAMGHLGISTPGGRAEAPNRPGRAKGVACFGDGSFVRRSMAAF